MSFISKLGRAKATPAPDKTPEAAATPEASPLLNSKAVESTHAPRRSANALNTLRTAPIASTMSLLAKANTKTTDHAAAETSTAAHPLAFLKKFPVIKECTKFHAAASNWEKASLDNDEQAIKDTYKKGYQALASLSIDLATLALILTGAGAAASGAQAATTATAASNTQVLVKAATGAAQVAKSKNFVVNTAKRKALSVLVENKSAQHFIEQLFQIVLLKPPQASRT